MKKQSNLATLLLLLTIGSLAASLAVSLTGCDIGADSSTLCTYNSRLENEYAFASDASRLKSVRDYLFDAKGTLLQVTNRSNDKLHYYEAQLPQGAYTLVSWANIGNKSVVNREAAAETKIDDMCLSMQAPAANSGYQQCSEMLYYGTVAFTVSPTGIYRSTLPMQRAYASLRVQVKWTNPQQIPADNHRFNLRLHRIRGRYAFRQPFASIIPPADEISYQTQATMNETGEVAGELITYRYANTTHPHLRLYDGDTPITSEVDLTQLFDKLEVDMNKELRQEYQSILEINGDKMTIILNPTKE